jgi:hypothetical protein
VTLNFFDPIGVFRDHAKGLPFGFGCGIAPQIRLRLSKRTRLDLNQFVIPAKDYYVTLALELLNWIDQTQAIADG